MWLKRYALIAAGSLFVAVGAVGVVVPVLPTTPFLLLAAACYIRSSPRFYRWLLGNRILGRYIRDYLSGAGIPVRTKITALSLLWLTILISVIYFVEITAVRVLLLIVATGVSIHILSIPSAKAR